MAHQGNTPSAVDKKRDSLLPFILEKAFSRKKAQKAQEILVVI